MPLSFADDLLVQPLRLKEDFRNFDNSFSIVVARTAALAKLRVSRTFE
jgi:hypothetical protein